MATVAVPELSVQQRERTFYFRMSLVFLAAAIAGFGFFFAIGASTFASPWWVHVHAVTMSAFLSLYVVQNFSNAVAVVELSPDGTSGTVVDTIMDADFQVPTTVAKFGKSLFLPNARFDTPPTPETEYAVVRIDR